MTESLDGGLIRKPLTTIFGTLKFSAYGGQDGFVLNNFGGLSCGLKDMQSAIVKKILENGFSDRRFQNEQREN